MTFIENEIYVDRNNTQYRYIERRGGVTVFIIFGTEQRTIRNSVGRFRWDELDTSVDIIGKLDRKSVL
jgi:hypothetical protein